LEKEITAELRPIILKAAKSEKRVGLSPAYFGTKRGAWYARDSGSDQVFEAKAYRQNLNLENEGPAKQAESHGI